jgi:hypothetical protein
MEDVLFGGGDFQTRNCVGRKGSSPTMLLKISLKSYIYIYIMNKNTKMMKGSIIHLIQRKIKSQNITLINIEIYYIHAQNILRTT